MKKSIILSMIIVFLAACVSNDVKKIEADTVKEVEKDIRQFTLPKLLSKE